MFRIQAIRLVVLCAAIAFSGCSKEKEAGQEEGNGAQEVAGNGASTASLEALPAWANSCDSISDIVEVLDAASPSVIRAMVARGVRMSCSGLPAPLNDWLERVERDDARVPDPGDDVDRLLGLACADVPGLRGIRELPPEEGIPALLKTCAIPEEIGTHEELTHATGVDELVLASVVFHVTSADCKTCAVRLARILAGIPEPGNKWDPVALLGQLQPSLGDTSLPRSIAVTPMRGGLLVSIAADAILVFGQSVVPVRDGRVAEEHLENVSRAGSGEAGGPFGVTAVKGPAIAPLRRAVADEKRSSSDPVELSEPPELILAVGDTTPYSLLAQVLRSTEMEELHRVRLVLAKTDDGAASGTPSARGGRVELASVPVVYGGPWEASSEASEAGSPPPDPPGVLEQAGVLAKINSMSPPEDSVFVILRDGGGIELVSNGKRLPALGECSTPGLTLCPIKAPDTLAGYDWAGLYTLLEEMLARPELDGHLVVQVAAEDPVPFGVLVRCLDTVRYRRVYISDTPFASNQELARAPLEKKRGEEVPLLPLVVLRDLAR